MGRLASPQQDGWSQGLTGPQGSQSGALSTYSSRPGTENKETPHDEGCRLRNWTALVQTPALP